MRLSVHLDGQPRIVAEEVEDVRPRGMLPTEFETIWPLTKPMPKDYLR
jgi:hypothetical protein